jgi:hypothetical protein
MKILNEFFNIGKVKENYLSSVLVILFVQPCLVCLFCTAVTRLPTLQPESSSVVLFC